MMNETGDVPHLKDPRLWRTPAKTPSQKLPNVDQLNAACSRSQPNDLAQMVIKLTEQPLNRGWPLARLYYVEVPTAFPPLCLKIMMRAFDHSEC